MFASTRLMQEWSGSPFGSCVFEKFLNGSVRVVLHAPEVFTGFIYRIKLASYHFTERKICPTDLSESFMSHGESTVSHTFELVYL